MPTSHTNLPRLLCIGNDEGVLRSQAAVFSRFGYPLAVSLFKGSADAAVPASGFDIAVLNHTLTRDIRQQLAKTVKQKCPRALVLALHASGGLGNPVVDAAVDSRVGPQAIVERLKVLASMLAVRDHNHPELSNRYVAVVNADRCYTFVSEGVSELLGYSRAEIIGREIEEIVYPKSADVEGLFRDFVRDGGQQGQILLRHRAGHPIAVRYSSTAYPDGCLVAEWAPIELSQ